MAEDEVTLNGKLLKDLKVTELRDECKARQISHNGTKASIIRRLSAALELETLQKAARSLSEGSMQPNSNIDDDSDNAFVKQYLENQRKMLLKQQHRFSETESEEDSPKKSCDSISSTIEKDCVQKEDLHEDLQTTLETGDEEEDEEVEDAVDQGDPVPVEVQEGTHESCNEINKTDKKIEQASDFSCGSPLHQTVERDNNAGNIEITPHAEVKPVRQAEFVFEESRREVTTNFPVTATIPSGDTSIGKEDMEHMHHGSKDNKNDKKQTNVPLPENIGGHDVSSEKEAVEYENKPKDTLECGIIECEKQREDQPEQNKQDDKPSSEVQDTDRNDKPDKEQQIEDCEEKLDQQQTDTLDQLDKQNQNKKDEDKPHEAEQNEEQINVQEDCNKQPTIQDYEKPQLQSTDECVHEATGDDSQMPEEIQKQENDDGFPVISVDPDELMEVEVEELDYDEGPDIENANNSDDGDHSEYVQSRKSNARKKKKKRSITKEEKKTKHDKVVLQEIKEEHKPTKGGSEGEHKNEISGETEQREKIEKRSSKNSVKETSFENEHKAMSDAEKDVEAVSKVHKVHSRSNTDKPQAKDNKAESIKPSRRRISLKKNTLKRSLVSDQPRERKRKWGKSSSIPDESQMTISSESLKNIIKVEEGAIKDAVVDLESSAPDHNLSEEEEEEEGEIVEEIVVEEVEEVEEKMITDDVEENLDENDEDDRMDGDREAGEVVDDEKEEASKHDLRKVVNKDDVKNGKKISHATSPTASKASKSSKDKSASRHDKRARSPDKKNSRWSGEASTIIHVSNLVRPFALSQLKQLLREQGPFIESSFWIDQIKSHCFVTYESQEVAEATRQALFGIQWPTSSPKKLMVAFSSEDKVEWFKKQVDPQAVKEGKQASRKATKIDTASDPVKSSQPAKANAMKRVAEEKPRSSKDESSRRSQRSTETRSKRDAGPADERERRHSGSGQQRERARDQSTGGRRGGGRSRDRNQREWDMNKLDQDMELKKRKQRANSVEHHRSREEPQPPPPPPPEPPKLLDDLFRKTKSTPCIYWLPLSEKTMAERDRKLAELEAEKELDRERRREERAKLRKEQEEKEKKAMEEQRARREKERNKSAGSRRRDERKPEDKRSNREENRDQRSGRGREESANHVKRVDDKKSDISSSLSRHFSENPSKESRKNDQKKTSSSRDVHAGGEDVKKQVRKPKQSSPSSDSSSSNSSSSDSSSDSSDDSDSDSSGSETAPPKAKKSR